MSEQKEFPYAFPQIPYLKLRFQITSLQNAHLPVFKGSLLRGAFGHALRRTVCAMPPKQLCESCLLKTRCAYPHLFETFIDKEPPPFLRGLYTAPRPYIIEPFEMHRRFSPGQTLQFDFLLTGFSIELFPYVIFAVSRMTENGLGRNRYPFRLENVWWRHESDPDQTWRPLYDGKSQTILDAPTPSLLDATPDYEADAPNSCRLSFLTPTRLKFKNDLVIEFTFRMLVFKMIRRVLELAWFHVPDAKIDWEFHDLLVAANDVRIVDPDLRWIDWQRHSNRQKTTMKMGGFTGDLLLQGNLAPFFNLLRTCEVLHIGKGVVFGNGKIEVSQLEEQPIQKRT